MADTGSKATILVTGGAGFIGSNLVRRLLDLGNDVRVLDDLSTGSLDNVDRRAEFVKGDITDEAVVGSVADGVEVAFHLAAFRSVIGSVEHPLVADRVNTHGTLTLLNAAVAAGIRRFVYASSSSVYGGSARLPTPESAPLAPRSPYAVSKLAGEQYARVFAELHGLETVSLRYFNVFGPCQRPDSPYAAVIPLFMNALQRGERPVVHGDGRQSHDFTYVDDVVGANLAAAAAPVASVSGRAFNVAPGQSHSILELISTLARFFKVKPDPVHTEPRAGDIRHSRADVTAARGAFGFEASVAFEEGLSRTVEWFSGISTG